MNDFNGQYFPSEIPAERVQVKFEKVAELDLHKSQVTGKHIYSEHVVLKKRVDEYNEVAVLARLSPDALGLEDQDISEYVLKNPAPYHDQTHPNEWQHYQRLNSEDKSGTLIELWPSYRHNVIVMKQLKALGIATLEQLVGLDKTTLSKIVNGDKMVKDAHSYLQKMNDANNYSILQQAVDDKDAQIARLEALLAENSEENKKIEALEAEAKKQAEALEATEADKKKAEADKKKAEAEAKKQAASGNNQAA